MFMFLRVIRKATFLLQKENSKETGLRLLQLNSL